jgi:hypothetical protein
MLPQAPNDARLGIAANERKLAGMIAASFPSVSIVHLRIVATDSRDVPIRCAARSSREH